MKKIRFIIVLVVLNIVSCSDSAKTISEGDLPIINLDTIQITTSLLHSFDNISEISLEANSNSFINFVDQVRVNDNDIFVLDKAQKSIFRFNRDGRYLSKINSVGQGPGEYMTILDFLLKDDKVYILEFRGTILIYELDGTFIEKIDLPFQANYFEHISKSKFIFQDIRIDGDFKFSAGIYCFNENKFIDSMETTKGINDGSFPFLRLKHLWLGSEGIYFNYDYSDIVYKITSTQITPTFQFLSSSFPSEEEIRNYNANPLTRQDDQAKKIFKLTDIFEYDGYVYFSFHENYKSRKAMFSLKEKTFEIHKEQFSNFLQHHKGQIISYNFPGMFEQQNNDQAVNPIIIIQDIN